jgi:subtilisin family serine protease
MRSRSLLLLLSVFGVSLGTAACSVEPNEGPQPDKPSAPTQSASTQSALGLATNPHVTDEVLVQFKAGATATGKAHARGKVGGATSETIHTGPMKAAGVGELEVVKLPPGIGVAQAIGALAGDADVVFAEPNWIYQHQTLPNDTYVASGQLWGMTGEYGSRASTAWDAGHTGSSNVYVGIIDEGFMYAHEDLAANAWTNPFDGANGSDDDGNGYADDVHGWDFANNDNSTFDGVEDDHGTHVAGTIGATANNGKGVAGVVWNVKLISAKFLGRHGGSTSNAIKAVDYLTDLKTRHGLNLVASNNSWGGGGFSQALLDAIVRANAADILFIAAASNDGSDNDATPSYPSNYNAPNVIAVGALTKTGGVASFSNYGATTVDLFAPGTEIISSVPARSGKNVISAYASYGGTSMATPHVSGAAALYASTHPGARGADIKAAILGSVTPTPSLAGKCVTGGRLNVAGF